MSFLAQKLLQTYPIISEQVTYGELLIIISKLETVIARSTGSAVVEFGCYTGTTSLFIARVLQADHAPYRFYVYDSFSGLPEKQRQDFSPAGTQFVPGSLNTSKQIFVRNFRKANLKLPVIHTGWFEEIEPKQVPDNIGFAFLDGDYYSSIQLSLRIIEKKLSPNSIIIIDDYLSESLPGAKKATDEWLSKNLHKSLQVQAGMAIIHDGN